MTTSERIARCVAAVVEAAGSFDPEGIVDVITDAARAVVGADYAGMHRVEGDGTHTVLTEIGASAPLREADDQTLVAAIRVAGQPFGELLVRRSDAAFSAADNELVAGLAAVAGVALHNARRQQESRRRERALEAVRSVTEALLERRGEDELLSEIARCARELVGADVATIAAVEDPETLWIRVADGARAEDLLGHRFPRTGSITAEAMSTGETIVIDDVSADPRARQPVVAVGAFGPTMFVPLQSGSHAAGTLLVSNLRGGDAFSDEDRQVVEILAAHASLALEYEEMERRARALELVQERDRIGQDLQDSAIRRLLGAGMALEQLATRVSASNPELAQQMNALSDEIDRSLREIRRMVFRTAD